MSVAKVLLYFIHRLPRMDMRFFHGQLKCIQKSYEKSKWLHVSDVYILYTLFKSE